MNLPKPSKKPSPGTKNQNPREILIQNCFFANFWCCNTTTWGSNPDRSLVAQWLNMRISPASCLPAPASQLPGLCLPASASRGPFRIAARPGVGGKPRAAGEVFRNHNTGRNCALFIRFAQLCLAGKGGSETSRARVHSACAANHAKASQPSSARQGRFRDLAGSHPPRLRSRSAAGTALAPAYAARGGSGTRDSRDETVAQTAARAPTSTRQKSG